MEKQVAFVFVIFVCLLFLGYRSSIMGIQCIEHTYSVESDEFWNMHTPLEAITVTE